jgi:hypothetical protein
MKKPTYVGFKHKEYKWKPDIDYRKNPHLYEIGRGQQGVLICQPYKSELHPLWRFKTPEEAQLSALRIINKFFRYIEQDDFVGADMAKKYLHMGFTRARRYFNHSSGKKWMMDYDTKEWKILPYDRTEQRFYDSSEIFKSYWKVAREDTRYLKMKKNFKKSKKSA